MWRKTPHEHLSPQQLPVRSQPELTVTISQHHAWLRLCVLNTQPKRSPITKILDFEWFQSIKVRCTLHNAKLKGWTMLVTRDCFIAAIHTIGGELYESVGVEAPILLSYTHKNECNTHGGLPTRCQRSAMGVSFIFVGVRQQNGCFDTHTFIQLSTYDSCTLSCIR